ncbi:hypothetical protein LEP1GSC196_1744 [Leptospira meyeri serovar Semaranga str. Veldrot Semarang 173]|nr:hypothetical protein LEP1GSC196_1744 [Leptospira meyeri serovar Semaranga str. Veldrot Semarang 173]
MQNKKNPWGASNPSRYLTTLEKRSRSPLQSFLLNFNIKMNCIRKGFPLRSVARGIWEDSGKRIRDFQN